MFPLNSSQILFTLRLKAFLKELTTKICNLVYFTKKEKKKLAKQPF